MSVGIRPGPRKSRLSTDSLQQVPRGNFQRPRARRLARTSQGGSAQVRTAHQSQPIPSLAQQSVAFVLRGRTSGAVAMVSRAELRSRGWGTGAGSRGSLRSVAASRDCHSHPRGVRWHHRCVFSPPKSSGPEGFSSRNPVAEFLRPLDGTVVPRKDRRPPPFVLEKKKKGKKTQERKKQTRASFSGTLCHIFFWAYLSQACPGAQLLLPSVASQMETLCPRFLRNLVFLLL